MGDGSAFNMLGVLSAVILYCAFLNLCVELQKSEIYIHAIYCILGLKLFLGYLSCVFARQVVFTIIILNFKEQNQPKMFKN